MRNHKIKIIALCILLALTISLFGVSIYLRNNNSDAETENAAAQSAAASITTAVMTTDSDTTDGGIGISPMGWWEDLWKIPEEIDAYGTVHAGDKNTTVSSGSYTNKAYGYTAPDDFPQFQYSYDNKNWDYTVLGTHQMFANTNTDGWRYYRGYKPSPKGDYSKVSSICLDTVKPQIQVRLNGNSIANGTVTTVSGSYFSVFATDDVSGVDSYWYKIGNGAYTSCTAYTYFYGDGVYSFYVKDKAGNVSDTVTVTRDTTAPTIRAYSGTTSSIISNGAYTTASSVRIEASDSTSGMYGMYIMQPGYGYYSLYSGASATFSTAGTYYYYARDNAGNYSATYYFTIDRTAPTAYLYSGTTSVSNGYYSAASYIRFTASDTNGCTIYMKKDSGSYSTYSSGTNQTAEGVYSFYAVDPAGNSTSTYTITLDRTAPTGTLYAGTTSVSSGKITNAGYVTYTATDNLALSTLYVLKPGASSYVTHTSGAQYTADGTYYFYATDKSGNASSTVSIVLDRTKPTATINAGGTIVSSGGYTNAASITFSASDATSGIANRYVRLPGSSSYISYVAGTPFSTEGIYYFYTTDVAGNTCDTVYVTVDRTVPTGTIAANGATVASGSFTSKAFYYTATDSLSGIAKYEIKRPGGAWEAYISGTTIAATSTQGLYSFRATDRAGNVSAEMTINLVTTAPTVTIYAGTTVVSSGTYTNSSYVAFTATALYGATASLYVKMPGASSYTAYTSGTQLATEGTYSFYATDNAGNTSATVSVTLDVTKPTGTLTAGGTTVASGSFTNKAFAYTASDSVSGLDKCEIKKPGGAWEAYTSGTTIMATSMQGLYSFRATDRAGNVSAETTINLVTTAPTVTIYAGTTVVSSGSFTNSSYVAFTASANNNASASLYVKMPGASSYTAYTSGTQLSTEGIYSFYATDNAGNTSATVSVTLDKSNPTGTITANGSTVQSGSYINSAFKYSATDSVSGIAKLEILRPNETWQTYGGEDIAANSANGWYCFRATDKAGNVSAESKIYLLTGLPFAQLYADEQPVIDGTYTNAARISMSAVGDYIKACYVKLPAASGFIPYNQYYTYTAAGRYEFYTEDEAGNKSDVFVIIIDRTAKPITLNGVSGNKASGNVTLSWTDGDLTTTAPIVTVTVNGVPYLKGDVIKTIDGGVYLIESTDAAGNVWTATFTALRTEVLSDTLNKQYYETADSGGISYAFESYDNALAFGIARETALVRTAAWNSATWDGGIPMDSTDSANAQNGIYYIYKKSGDKSTEVAYFTVERLNAVIAEYAAESVSAYYWWQKTPAQINIGNDLYALTSDRVFVGSSVSLADHANYLIDGEPYFGLTYSAEGEHILTVFDDFGNSYDYTLIIVKSAPDIYYKLDGGAFNKAVDERLYAFKEAVTLNIEDEFGGEFAMYIIKNSAGETVAIVSYGTEYTLDKSGRYTVQAINHGGLSLEISFILSLESPTATFRENADSKRLEVRVEPSADSGTSLSEIRIYKSVDGGLTWVLLEVDDYGRTIGVNSLFYEFNRDGLYRVVVEDNFRSGIDAITAEIDYLKPAPEGKLYGVSGGGYTNESVRFSWTDEATATVTFDGVTGEYLSGTELYLDGEYALTFTDANGFEVTYSFTIKKAAPVLELSGEPVDGYLTTPVTVTFESGSAAALYKDGKLIGDLENGTLIDTDGEYKIVVTDLADNIATVSFTLDTTAPTAELVGVSDGGTMKGSVAIRNLSEPATVEVYLNGSLISYSVGDSLAELGLYRVTLTDAAGNMTEYTFEIVYSVNTAGVIIIIVVILGILGGGIAVFLFRKRGKFKSNK